MRHAISSASKGSREKNVRGAKFDGRNGREMHHVVSSASRGSREENVRGAKLTEKRTRGCHAVSSASRAPGKKRQGSSIDVEKENKSLNCQTYCPLASK